MPTREEMIQKIRDDLLLNGKQKIMDLLPENQNALFLGKMRIPTKAHFAIISEAIEKYNHVVVCIVKTKQNDQINLPLDIQKELLYKKFGKKITIITHSTGNLLSIVNKSPKRLRFVLAGTDRFESYARQLVKTNLKVVEIKRNIDSEENISATKTLKYVIDDNYSKFKSMTDPLIHPYFDYLKSLILEKNVK